MNRHVLLAVWDDEQTTLDGVEKVSGDGRRGHQGGVTGASWAGPCLALRGIKFSFALFSFCCRSCSQDTPLALFLLLLAAVAVASASVAVALAARSRSG